MKRTFRVTYVRSIYNEVELAAEDHHGAEVLFEMMATALLERLEAGTALTKPQYRIVDVVAVNKVDGRRTGDRRQAVAAGASAGAAACPDIVEPAA